MPTMHRDLRNLTVSSVLVLVPFYSTFPHREEADSRQ
jgi:hypothetical protein